MKQRISNIAIYLRLSKDDNDREESESIKNQREMIYKYIENNFIYDNIYEYVDDGYSGSNFNRPDFKRMIQELKEKKICLVITKNLARFARNYIDAGEYIEKFFPNNNIRYIAILDGVDTNEEKMENDIAPFKGLFNEMYCRETSRNIKATKRKQIKDGDLIRPIAPYGYIKNPENPKELLIDDEAAKVVKKIFMMKYEGCTARQIANYLNDKKIKTPSQYLNIFNDREIKIWTGDGVSRLLSKPVYVGDSYLGRSTNINYKTKKKVYYNRKNSVLIKEDHLAIISREIFDEIHNNNKYNNQKRKKANVSTRIGDYIYCGVCGRKMGKRNRKGKISLHCSANRSSEEICDNNCSYQYDAIEKYIIESLNKEYKDFIKESKNRISKKIQSEKENTILKQKKKIESDLKKVVSKISELYSYRLNGKITEIEYKERYTMLINEREKLQNEITSVNNDINELQDKVKVKNNLRNAKRKIDRISMNKFKSEDIDLFIKRVDLKYNDILIKFKFKK